MSDTKTLQNSYSRKELLIDSTTFLGVSAISCAARSITLLNPAGIGLFLAAGANSASLSAASKFLDSMEVKSISIKVCALITTLALSAIALPYLIGSLALQTYALLSIETAVETAIIHLATKLAAYSAFRIGLYFKDSFFLTFPKTIAGLRNLSSPQLGNIQDHLVNFPSKAAHLPLPFQFELNRLLKDKELEELPLVGFSELGDWSRADLHALIKQDMSKLPLHKKAQLNEIFFAQNIPPQNRSYERDELPELDMQALTKNPTHAKAQWYHLILRLKKETQTNDLLSKVFFDRGLPPTRDENIDLPKLTSKKQVEALQNYELDWYHNLFKKDPSALKALPSDIQLAFLSKLPHSSKHILSPFKPLVGRTTKAFPWTKLATGVFLGAVALGAIYYFSPSPPTVATTPTSGPIGGVILSSTETTETLREISDHFIPNASLTSSSAPILEDAGTISDMTPPSALTEIVASNPLTKPQTPSLDIQLPSLLKPLGLDLKFPRLPNQFSVVPILPTFPRSVEKVVDEIKNFCPRFPGPSACIVEEAQSYLNDSISASQNITSNPINLSLSTIGLLSAGLIALSVGIHKIFSNQIQIQKVTEPKNSMDATEYEGSSPPKTNDSTVSDTPPKDTIALHPVGIKNIGGNDCWANSTLQLIATSPSLASKILENETFAPLLQNYYKAQQDNQQVSEVDSSEFRKCCKSIDNSPLYQNDPFDALVDIFGEINFNYNFKQNEIFDLEGFDLETSKIAFRPEPMISLDLEDDKRDFQDLLQAFLNSPYVDLKGQNGVHRLKFQETPEDLFIHAKRFRRTQEGAQFKIKDDIENIPEEFTLDPNNIENDQDASYELSGCIIHKGEELSSGHYVALVKKPEGWFYISDHEVEMKSDKEAQDLLKQGYIFLYRKTENEVGDSFDSGFEDSD